MCILLSLVLECIHVLLTTFELMDADRLILQYVSGHLLEKEARNTAVEFSLSFSRNCGNQKALRGASRAEASDFRQASDNSQLKELQHLVLKV